jgi:hypothetical protein
MRCLSALSALCLLSVNVLGKRYRDFAAALSRPRRLQTEPPCSIERGCSGVRLIMTWVCAASTIYGYGALYSDVQVTFLDGQTADLVQKAYPLSNFIDSSLGNPLKFPLSGLAGKNSPRSLLR